VVIGGGLIGIEVAAALAGARRRVVLIEKENQLLPGLLDPEMAAFVTREMEMNQVEVRTGAAVSGIDTGPSGKKEVLLSGERLAADLVILACGVRPNVELAQTAGLAIGSTGALQVNEYLQTSNPDIYAAGDCVENKHLVSDRPVYMPLASTANKQGR